MIQSELFASFSGLHWPYQRFGWSSLLNDPGDGSAIHTPMVIGIISFAGLVITKGILLHISFVEKSKDIIEKVNQYTKYDDAGEQNDIGNQTPSSNK